MGVLQNEVAFTFAAGANQSSVGFLGAGAMARLRMPPSVWTAASLSFLSSYDNVLYQPLFDSAGVEITITVTAGKDIPLPAIEGLTYIKLQSGTSAAAVNQVAATTLSIITNRRTIK